MLESKKSKFAAAILAIAIIAYNAVLFAICDFKGHTGAFWTSWIFMLISFATMTVSGVVLGQKGRLLHDWLFNFPIIRHSAIYIAAEFVVSTVFIILESHVKWSIAFAVQFLLLCVYGIFAVSCLLSKEVIEDVHDNVSDKTLFIKLLRADTEMLVEKCSDAETKEQYRQLAGAIRYSDPMSNEALFELEKELALAVADCDKAIVANDFEGAKELCKKASLLLSERNKKCKALK